jgi:hypothetical protein
MPRRFTSPGEPTERHFAWLVDIVVAEPGARQRLADMLGWLERRVARDAWEHQGLSLDPASGAAQDWVRFSFREEPAARAFQAVWGGRIARSGAF